MQRYFKKTLLKNEESVHIYLILSNELLNFCEFRKIVGFVYAKNATLLFLNDTYTAINFTRALISVPIVAF